MLFLAKFKMFLHVLCSSLPVVVFLWLAGWSCMHQFLGLALQFCHTSTAITSYTGTNSGCNSGVCDLKAPQNATKQPKQNVHHSVFQCLVFLVRKLEAGGVIGWCSGHHWISESHSLSSTMSGRLKNSLKFSSAKVRALKHSRH